MLHGTSMANPQCLCYQACANMCWKFSIQTHASFQRLTAFRLTDTPARFLKERFGFKGDDLKYAAYLLVTYAIEVRADDLYPQYQEVLDGIKSNVNVKSIIAEEINHLAEMTLQLQQFSADWKELCTVVCDIEKDLFMGWINAVKKEISIHN